MSAGTGVAPVSSRGLFIEEVRADWLVRRPPLDHPPTSAPLIDRDETLHRLHCEALTLLLAVQSIPLALDTADYAVVLQTGRVALEGVAADLRDNELARQTYLGSVGEAPIWVHFWAESPVG